MMRRFIAAWFAVLVVASPGLAFAQAEPTTLSYSDTFPKHPHAQPHAIKAKAAHAAKPVRTKRAKRPASVR